ncbi:hypothetical protein JCM12141A_00490 [Mycolicibacterium hodleri]
MNGRPDTRHSNAVGDELSSAVPTQSTSRVNENVGRQLSARRKAFVLASCCLSVLIVSIDVTIINVAVPSMRAGLSASPSQMQWVFDIYTLMVASLTP